MHSGTFVHFIIAAALLALTTVLPAQTEAQLEIGGGKLDIEFSEVPDARVRTLALDWISTAARTVTLYHRRFPVSHVQIRVRIRGGHGATHGTTYGWNGALITVTLGRASTAEDLRDDWLLTHEMFHLGFPSLAERHHWAEEGISTYAEAVARARSGILSPERVWGDFVRDMPQGQPESDDKGLDFTPTWGRTYWGGAIFWLLADVRIRQRTENRLGLEHAIRAIVSAGGTIETEWELEHAIEVGDKATGVPVLHELYEKMRASPSRTDLESLWKQLGIERRGGRLTLSDTAPLAKVRTAITAKP